MNAKDCRGGVSFSKLSWLAKTRRLANFDAAAEAQSGQSDEKAAGTLQQQRISILCLSAFLSRCAHSA